MRFLPFACHSLSGIFRSLILILKVAVDETSSRFPAADKSLSVLLSLPLKCWKVYRFFTRTDSGSWCSWEKSRLIQFVSQISLILARFVQIQHGKLVCTLHNANLELCEFFFVALQTLHYGELHIVDAHAELPSLSRAESTENSTPYNRTIWNELQQKKRGWLKIDEKIVELELLLLLCEQVKFKRCAIFPFFFFSLFCWIVQQFISRRCAEVWLQRPRGYIFSLSLFLFFAKRYETTRLCTTRASELVASAEQLSTLKKRRVFLKRDGGEHTTNFSLFPTPATSPRNVYTKFPSFFLERKFSQYNHEYRDEDEENLKIAISSKRKTRRKWIFPSIVAAVCIAFCNICFWEMKFLFLLLFLLSFFTQHWCGAVGLRRREGRQGR